MNDFRIVGIGASAGGIEAFTKLLSNLPLDTGLAFILIQHLDPKHESMSTEILSRTTKMPVTEIINGILVEPNSIYVLPPNFDMIISQGVLTLTPRTEVRGRHLVIDKFFKSLAEDQKNLAIGVVLSGTGSDGTQGLTAIKIEGGITFAQTLDSSRFVNMPDSAIKSGNVDYVLSPENIAKELSRIAKHQYTPHVITELEVETRENQQPKIEDNLGRIFLLMRNHCHVDFTFYKSNTIMRRIDRQMLLHKIKDLSSYADFLTREPKEIKALCADILIHVTGFFRDPEAYRALSTEVFPKLLKKHKAGDAIRIWSPGCSTGEEVYSLAISILEFLGDKASHTPIQIFATDISESAIQKARIGEYSEAAVEGISSERLSRYFLKLDNGGYKVVKSIRDFCVFSRHDITTDPPFAKIDLISCRNLLIYFSLTLQKHVIPAFHYSLVPEGFLWLGKSETIGGFPDLFTLVDKVNKIYQRKDAPVSLKLRFPSSTFVYGKQDTHRESKSFPKPLQDMQKIVETALFGEFPGVVVNADMEILQICGSVYPFISPASGTPSYNLLKMAHPDILRDLRLAIEASKKSKKLTVQEGLSLSENRKNIDFSLRVIPITPTRAKGLLFLVLFEKREDSSVKTKEKKDKLAKLKLIKSKLSRGNDPYLKELQLEIAEAREYQKALIEKFEMAQDELITANEELQSANEELQSTNEELETAKEELQSGNEELTTVNDELSTRSLEQNQTNNDLINLLGSVEIPIVMLSDDRRVRRFTPLAGKALNLIPADVGRPLSDLKLNFTAAPGTNLDLEQMVSETIATANSQELEVQDRKGRWFRLQVRPYKTLDNMTDGAVLALVDIDDLKQSLTEIKKARAEADKANRAKDLFLATLSHELRTPMTAILSWAQMLRSGKLDADKINRGLSVIEESGKTQAQLINDLLDVSRIVSGKFSLDMHETDPTVVVKSAIEAVDSLAKEKSIRIESSIASNIGTVMADSVRLKQVFWNLLTNAIKFSAPNSKVSINVERIQDKDDMKAKACIQVIDSGKGIDAEFLPEIFDRFSQQDSSSVRVHGGLGLGLAIVSNLVELHGGSVRAESLGLNKGATFTVLLPIKSEQVILASKIDSTARSFADDKKSQQLKDVKILVVEDEVSSREALTELLSTFGAIVKAASSAQEALSLFSNFKPQVLVSDIAMPIEDGYSLIKKIRSLGDEHAAGVPALALTAYAGSEDVKRALDAGFHAHLAKPVDGKHLLEAITKLLNGN